MKLSSIQEEMCQKLTPFQKVESIMKRLDSSAIAVTSESFLDILNDVDECTEYFKTHVSAFNQSEFEYEVLGIKFSVLRSGIVHRKFELPAQE